MLKQIEKQIKKSNDFIVIFVPLCGANITQSPGEIGVMLLVNVFKYVSSGHSVPSDVFKMIKNYAK